MKNKKKFNYNMALSIIIDLVIIFCVAHLAIANVAIGYVFKDSPDDCLREGASCNSLITADFLRKQKEEPVVLSVETVRTPEGPQLIGGYEDPKLEAKSYILVEPESKKVLYAKNTEEVLPIASITKLMTALVFLDNNPGWDTVVQMTAGDETEGAVSNFLRGEKVTAKDLFYAMLIGSDNNAAMALSRSTGLAEVDFLKAMNRRAAGIGLANTYFTDQTGLLRTNVSTARELSILALDAFSNEDIRKVSSMPYFTFRTLDKKISRTVKSTNQLLRGIYGSLDYEVLGSKTGHIIESGYNLVMYVSAKDGRRVLAVILGTMSNPDRFGYMKEIIDWTFENYTWGGK